MKLSYDQQPLDSSERLIRLGSAMIAISAICALLIANVPPGRPYAEVWQRTFSVAFGASYTSGPFRAWVTDALLPIVCFVSVIALRRLASGVRQAPARWPAFVILLTWLVLLVLFADARSQRAAVDNDVVNGTLALVLLLCLNRARIGHLWPYLFTAGVLLWFGRTTHGVVHAAILGFALPLVALRNELTFMFRIDSAVDRLETAHGASRTEEQDESLAIIADAADAEISPARRAERFIAPMVASSILPVVVLANAGVPVGELKSTPDLDVLTTAAVGTAFFVVAVRLATLRLIGHSARVAFVATAIGFAMCVCLAALMFQDNPRLGAPMAGIWAGVILGTCAIGAIPSRLLRRLSDEPQSAVVLPFPRPAGFPSTRSSHDHRGS
jgi:Na+/H+ antiporter NhaA